MAITLEEQKIDEAKLQAVIGKVVTDFGSTISAGLMVLGDKLGLYKAMANSDPVTSQELADLTGTSERYIREWLVNQAAGGYIEYDPETGRYTLPLESALALAIEDNPFFVVGGFELFLSALRAEPRNRRGFPHGRGYGLGRARPRLIPRHRALFQARLPWQPGEQLAARARRRGAEA